MKNVAILLILIISALSCSNRKNNGDNRDIILNDTITKPSGLKYIFLKEEKGRKIEVGSKVKSYADLYINYADTIFWTTSTGKDSIFQFIHGKTSLIKGFSELNNYLVEGDEVIAILPDSLAYGKEGRHGIPPGATLLYNPYIVKDVSKPKEVLSDTLYAIASSENARVAISFYEKVMNCDLKNDYHTEIANMIDLMTKLNNDSLYTESQHLADYFVEKTEEDHLQERFKRYKLFALEAQGKFKKAIVLAETLTKQDSNQEWWQTKLSELQKKLNNQ